MKHDRIICRCEEVSLHEIQDAIARGASTARQVKLATRAGMGFCQGRTCRPFLETIVSSEAGQAPDVGPSLLAFKPPARPITFGMLAGEERP